MADVNRGKRPLSPHLSVYRPQMSSVSSIFIRITGVALAGSVLLLVLWLLLVFGGPEKYAAYAWIFSSNLVSLIWVASLWALIYHTLGGLRHLVFDMGYGFDLRTADLMGWGMFGLSFLLTAILVFGVF
ncbi:MAG: succinate dehydrogenase, cytochrome b556 subunit [Pseudomonadota bacterium]